MESILTGSHVYGLPRQDSDLDMVVLIEKNEDYFLLSRIADNPLHNQTPSAYNGVSLRYGKLNIIAVLKDRKVFEAWKRGTEFLKSIRPVTKEQACLIFETMFKIVKEPVQVDDLDKLPF